MTDIQSCARDAKDLVSLDKVLQMYLSEYLAISGVVYAMRSWFKMTSQYSRIFPTDWAQTVSNKTIMYFSSSVYATN